MLQFLFIANTVLWPLKAKLGGTSLGLNVVVLILVGVVWIGKSLKITGSSARLLFFLAVFAISSFFVALAGPCTDLFIKSMATLPGLMFLLLLGFEVGRRANGSDWLSLQTMTGWALLAAFLAFIVELLMPGWFPAQAGYRSEGKLSGLFQEPSHVAFGLFPCIAVLLVAENKKTRQKGMLALIGLLVVSRSSTLIAFMVAWFLYRLIVQRSFRQSAPFAIGIIVLFGLGAVIDYGQFVTPTMGRVVGIAESSETSSPSSLVYVQGWQDTWFNLQRTHGMGLGLNMMGCSPVPDVSVRSVLALTGLGDLNAMDGSFPFAKIVSETGVVGILFYIVTIWWWLRLEKELRGPRKGTDHFVLATQSALIFCFLASSFIRGAGYFEGGILLWIAAVGGASKWQRNLAAMAAGLGAFSSTAHIIDEPRVSRNEI